MEETDGLRRRTSQADHNIQDLFLELSGITTQLTHLTKLGERHEKRLDGMASKQDEFLHRFDGVDKKLVDHDKRFDAMDQRFDGVDKRLDGVDKKLVDHDKRFDAVDKRLDGVDKKLVDHDKRFDAVDKRFDGVDQRLDGVESKLDKGFDEVGAKLDLMTQVVGQYGEQLDRMDDKADQMEKVQSASLVKLEVVGQRLKETTGDVSLMESTTRQFGKVLPDHTVALGRIAATLDEHSALLRKHAETFGVLVTTVGKQADVLRPLATTVTEHTDVLRKHGLRFDRVDSRFDSVDTVLAEIVRKLDDPGA